MPNQWTKHPKTELERFLRHVNKLPNGCWEYVGIRDACGYARFWKSRKRLEQAHRTSCRLFGKPCKRELTVDHLCRNRSCVNPAHLEPNVPISDNVLRGEGICVKNLRKGMCVRGHSLSDGNVRRYKTRRICLTCDKKRMADYSEARRQRKLLALGAKP